MIWLIMTSLITCVMKVLMYCGMSLNLAICLQLCGVLFATEVAAVGRCHRKNGPGKNGPAGPILDEKMVRPDHSWP